MSLARRHFQQLYKQARLYLPKDQRQAPSLTPVPRGHGFAFVTPPDRSISANPGFRKQLKGMDTKDTADPKGTRFTEYHELGHVMGAGSEGHANRIANLLIRAQRDKITKKQARRRIRKTLGTREAEDV